MATMNMIQALNSALDVMMERDGDVVSFGEDAGYFGGVFRVTANLQKKYGLDRSFDAPINEAAIVAMAIGMAARGRQRVADIQFAGAIFPGLDPLVAGLSGLRYRQAGPVTAPVVLRTPCGGGGRGSQTHQMSRAARHPHRPGVRGE